MGLSDRSTRVKLTEKNISVRELLTRPLKLNDRGRVLWIAETELGGKETTVRYLIY